MPSRRHRPLKLLGTPGTLAWMLIVVMAVAAPNADAQPAGDLFEAPPVRYSETAVDDPVARLARRLADGDEALNHDSQFGYLPAVLHALDVPVESQVLVFSKTSLQLNRISPRRPRALYFNDQVYVGYCQYGDVLELAATDGDQGAIFYTLSQTDTGPPTLRRDQGACLTCHASSRTQNVPGYLVRSVFPDASGRPILGSGTFTTDWTSDFRDRWGGWYVTGRHGEMRHMGNTTFVRNQPTVDRESGANRTTLPETVDPEGYLSPHSDLVALMVLEHQTQMHNALAAANYETRRALHQSEQMNRWLERPAGTVSESARRRIDSAADRVLRHLLMCDEFSLSDPVSGTSGFAEQFVSRGRCDSRGRSLRDLDLHSRLFQYPCSYLIHSPAFDNLPPEVADPVRERLLAVLQGRDDDPAYSHLTPPMRTAIHEILKDTKPELWEKPRGESLDETPGKKPRESHRPSVKVTTGDNPSPEPTPSDPPVNEDNDP